MHLPNHFIASLPFVPFLGNNGGIFPHFPPSGKNYSRKNACAHPPLSGRMSAIPPNRGTIRTPRKKGLRRFLLHKNGRSVRATIACAPQLTSDNDTHGTARKSACRENFTPKDANPYVRNEHARTPNLDPILFRGGPLVKQKTETTMKAFSIREHEISLTPPPKRQEICILGLSAAPCLRRQVHNPRSPFFPTAPRPIGTGCLRPHCRPKTFGVLQAENPGIFRKGPTPSGPRPRESQGATRGLLFRTAATSAALPISPNATALSAALPSSAICLKRARRTGRMGSL